MEIIADEHEGGLTTPAPEPPSHTLPRPTPLSMYNGNVAVVIFLVMYISILLRKRPKVMIF